MNTESNAGAVESTVEGQVECQGSCQQVKRGRGRPKVHSDVPSYLVCSVSGVKVKTTPVQFRKQLEKSGLDVDTFLKTYVCRAARTALKNKVNG